MANYPLDYGWHTDPDTADESKSPDSPPATERYPLEWGTHLDPPIDDAPTAPVFTPVMPTLLGGAPPDTFPFGASPQPAPRGLTPVNWPGGNSPDGADSAQIAQAPRPTAQGKSTSPQQTAPVPTPAPLGPEELDRRATAAKQELNRLASITLPPLRPEEKQPIPADWERQLPRATLDALNASAARFGVPRELLARILWQESDFGMTTPAANAQGQGSAGISTGAIEALKTDARRKGDFARLNELQKLDRLKQPDAVNMAAQYLRMLYDENGQSWPAAVAAYKSGRVAAYGWLKGTGTTLPSNTEEMKKLGAYLQYVFQGDPGRFDRRSFPDIP